MPGPYNLSTLQQMVSQQIQDVNNVYFTLALITQSLNKGMARFCEDTKLRRATVMFDVPAMTATIDLSTTTPTILEILRVTFPSEEGGTDERPIRFATVAEIEDLDIYWRNRTGLPYLYIRETEGFDSIRIYPQPETDFFSSVIVGGGFTYDSGYGIINDFTTTPGTYTSNYGQPYVLEDKYGGMRVDYIAGAGTMANPTDDPFSTSGIPQQYHDAIFRYAMFELLSMDTPLQQIQRANGYYTEYERYIQDAQSKTRDNFQEMPYRPVNIQEF